MPNSAESVKTCYQCVKKAVVYDPATVGTHFHQWGLCMRHLKSEAGWVANKAQVGSRGKPATVNSARQAFKHAIKQGWLPIFAAFPNWMGDNRLFVLWDELMAEDSDAKAKRPLSTDKPPGPTDPPELPRRKVG